MESELLEKAYRIHQRLCNLPKGESVKGVSGRSPQANSNATGNAADFLVAEDTSRYDGVGCQVGRGAVSNMIVFDKSAWKKYMDGFFVRDCTFGFEDGRLGFLIYEELEDDADLEEGWQMRLLAVKLSNPIDTRFFYITTNAIGVGGMIASAWHPQQQEFVVAGIGRQIYSYKPKEYKGREPDIPFPAAGKLKPDAYS